MSISTLDWFIELASTDPSTPSCGIGLALELKPAVDEALNSWLDPKSTKRKISRIFQRRFQSLTAIDAWLNGSDMQSRINTTNNQIIKSAYKESRIAITEIISGTTASQAWDLGKKRGATVGISETLEAAALVGFLIKEKQFNFSKNEALEAAAAIFELNSDEIRRYKTLSAINDASEAALALSAIIRYDKIEIADCYFDIEVLRERAIK